MPRRRRQPKRRSLDLGTELELMLGPSNRTPFPAAPWSLRVAWEQHGAGLLEELVLAGARPWAWWKVERDMDPPEDEVVWLAEHNELDDQEAAEILALAAASPTRRDFALAALLIRRARGAPVGDDEIAEVRGEVERRHQEFATRMDERIRELNRS